MITLRPLFAALAFFNSRQLFQLPMKPFYHPTPLVLILNDRRIHRTWGAIRNHPINVTVRGDPLEKLHLKRNFFQLNRYSIPELFLRPFYLLKMNIALLWTQTHTPILLQSSHKNICKPMNKLEIFNRRIPTVKQNRLRFNRSFSISLPNHISKVFIFRFAIGFWGIDSKVYRIIILFIAMNSIDNTDALH